MALSADDITADVVIIGGGIAGVSLGYELAANRSVCLLEAESTLAFHSTGRSAAAFIETYGGPEVRALTSSSRAFLVDPPDYWKSTILTPLSQLQVATADTASGLRALFDEVSTDIAGVELLTPEEAEDLNPVLRPGVHELAMLEVGAMEVDVHAMHGGYLRGLRALGGRVVTNSRVISAARDGSAWTLRDSAGRTVRAEVVVNAAGAWVDQVAATCQVAPMNAHPTKRSVFMLGGPPRGRVDGIPLTTFHEAGCYIKPEGGQFLCSPVDETSSEPADVKPDQLEIARALDVLGERTLIDARYVRNAWAGLRTFGSDRVPVLGFDSGAAGFFWIAGQGGFGIQTAPSLARVGAAMILGTELPADVLARGLDASALAPGRAGLAGPLIDH